MQEQDTSVPPVLPLPAPSGHIMQPDFTSEPSKTWLLFFFFFESFVSCPLSTGKVPTHPHPTLRPGCLCFSHNLCFLYWHISIYNSKAVWFPAQTERNIPGRVQGLYHMDQTLYSPCRVKHTGLRVIWSGTGTGQQGKGPANK